MILVLIVVILLTGVYILMLASLAWQDVVTGLGLAIVLLAIFRAVLLPPQPQPAGQTLRAIVWFPLFALVSVRNIVTGSLTVATFVIGLRPLETPGIVAVPIGARSPTAVGLSGMLLTMSPGSYLVDVDWERRVMLVHVMDASDPDAVREDLQTFYYRYQRHVVP